MLDLTPVEERLAMRTAFLAVQDDEEGPSALEQVTLLDYGKLIAEVKHLRELLTGFVEDVTDAAARSACTCYRCEFIREARAAVGRP